MNRIVYAFALLALATPGVTTAQSQSEPTTAPTEATPTTTPSGNGTSSRRTSTSAFEQQYGLLSSRNIFLRNRPRPRPVERNWRPATTREVIPTPPERNYVLRGVVLEDADLRAYVEDANTGRLLRLLPGDAVARGNITEIEVDAVRFEHDGNSIWVEIGQDFMGIPAAVVAPVVQPPAASSAPSDGPAGATSQPATPAGGANSALERMRQRRLQSLGGGG